MEKRLMYAAMAACIAFAAPLTGCSSDDDPETTPPAETPAATTELESDYFTIENATYRSGSMPASTDGSTIQGISMNQQALTGGMNYITIDSPVEYSKFLIGVEGVEGYYEFDAAGALARSGNLYVIPITFSVNYDGDFVLIVVAIDEDGNVTAPVVTPIEHVDSRSGDLNLNLTFSNAKDVDLHLYTPSNTHIYYGNRGGVYTKEDGTTGEFGLDHDSNAGCYIDNLNNENIFIPADLIEPGEYTVVVNMYSNCDTSTPTSWGLIARYQGEMLRPTTGHNPAAGVYQVGAGNSDFTVAMTFTLVEEEAAEAAARSTISFKSLMNYTPTSIDLMKMAEQEARDNE